MDPLWVFKGLFKGYLSSFKTYFFISELSIFGFFKFGPKTIPERTKNVPKPSQSRPKIFDFFDFLMFFLSF